MSIKISVIVPVYNTAPWLRRCLDSICTQSYRNLEILCVNDGSTDNSAEILEEYAAKDSRIKVFTQENAGLSAARNTALKHASGEWVTGVDSDDTLCPGIYEQCIAHCSERVDMVFFGVRVVTPEGKELNNDYFKLPEAGEYELSPEQARQLNVCFCDKLWRRSMLTAHNLQFPVGLVHEDEAMYWTAAPYIRRIAICPSIGYSYLQREGSITNDTTLSAPKRLERYMGILEYVHNEYEKRGLLKTAAENYLITFFTVICSPHWTPEKTATSQIIATAIEKCGMKYAHYQLERFFPHEHRGLLAVRRFKQVKLYSLVGIPIWFRLYTNYGKPVTLFLLLAHIRNFMKRRICRKKIVRHSAT